MTDSGLQGITYIAKPQRFNLNETSSVNATIELNLDVKEAVAGKYTVMVRISTLERNNLTVSHALSYYVMIRAKIKGFLYICLPA